MVFRLQYSIRCVITWHRIGKKPDDVTHPSARQRRNGDESTRRKGGKRGSEEGRERIRGSGRKGEGKKERSGEGEEGRKGEGREMDGWREGEGRRTEGREGETDPKERKGVAKLLKDLMLDLHHQTQHEYRASRNSRVGSSGFDQRLHQPTVLASYTMSAPDIA